MIAYTTLVSPVIWQVSSLTGLHPLKTPRRDRLALFAGMRGLWVGLGDQQPESPWESFDVSQPMINL